MKKFQSILPAAFFFIFALIACTRPISQRKQTSGSVTPSPPAATLTHASDSTSEDTLAPDISPTVPIPPQVTETQPVALIPVREIPLTGLIASPEAEISGMAWYGDVLILLPQYPNRFPFDGAGSVFALHKSEILDFLDGKSDAPLSPFQIRFSAPNLEKSIRGFEGFEAIAIVGDRVYLTIEASPTGMMSYLVAGQIAPEPVRIDIDESMLCCKDRLSQDILTDGYCRPIL